METTARVRADSDDDLKALRAVLAGWHFDEPVTAAVVVDEANPALRAALAELCGCPPDKLDTRKVGNTFKLYVERVADGRCFVKDGEHRRAALWTVRSV